MIIFDLDGCLANCEHRRHFVDPSTNPDYVKWHWYTQGDLNFEWVHKDTREKWEPNWPAFYEACDNDKPIIATMHLLISLWFREGEDVQIWSGRSESVRGKTEKWLSENIFNSGIDPCKLKMRPIGDTTPDDVLKELWLDEAIATGNKIDFVFDDRPKVIRMWQRRGIFVFNCAQSDKEF